MTAALLVGVLACGAIFVLRPSGAASTGDLGIPGLRAGMPAPPLDLHDVSGRPVSLTRLRGRWIILNFWGVTCPPCAREAPELERAYRAARNEHTVGLTPTIVGIDGDLDNVNAVRSFARSRGITYPLAIDSGLQAMSAYHIGALPTSLVVDPTGRVRRAYVGAMSGPEIERALRGRL